MPLRMCLSSERTIVGLHILNLRGKRKENIFRYDLILGSKIFVYGAHNMLPIWGGLGNGGSHFKGETIKSNRHSPS